MNEIAKKCIQDKLIAAIEKDHLKTSEAANLLKISPAYVSMIKNERHWGKCPSKVWEAVQRWTNSGVSLKMYTSEGDLLIAIKDHKERIQKQKDYMKGDKWDDQVAEVKEKLETEDQKEKFGEYVDGILLDDKMAKIDAKVLDELLEKIKSNETLSVLDEIEYIEKCRKINDEIRKELDSQPLIPRSPVKEIHQKLFIEIDISLSIDGKKININI